MSTPEAEEPAPQDDAPIIVNLEEAFATIKPTVVVPVFNTNPKFLRECIKSILNQTLIPEIIVVDDGSTDEGTIKELEKIESLVDTLHWGEHKGVAHALNVGNRLATGNAILAVGSDDYILRELVKQLTYTLFAKWDDDKFSGAGCYTQVGYSDVENPEMQFIARDLPGFSGKVREAMPQPLVKKWMLDKYPYDESLPRCVDLHLFRTIQEAYGAFIVVDARGYIARRHTTNITKDISNPNVRCYEDRCFRRHRDCPRIQEAITFIDRMKELGYEELVKDIEETCNNE